MLRHKTTFHEGGCLIFYSFFSMRYALNTKDEGVRDMLIDRYDELGITAFEREYRISARVARSWKQMKIATGSSAPHYSHVGAPSKISPNDVTKLENYLLKHHLPPTTS
jgi:hypothetical protein